MKRIWPHNSQHVLLTMHWTSMNVQCVADCSLKWLYWMFTTGLPWLIIAAYEIFSLIPRPSHHAVFDCSQYHIQFWTQPKTGQWEGTLRDQKWRPRTRLRDFVNNFQISLLLCDHHVFFVSVYHLVTYQLNLVWGTKSIWHDHYLATTRINKTWVLLHLCAWEELAAPERNCCSLPQNNSM